MKRITSVNVLSVFKMSLALGAAAGFLAGTVLFITSILEKNVREGVLTFIMAPVLYGLLGAVVNSILAWVYNRVAAALGGIEIAFDD